MDKSVRYEISLKKELTTIEMMLSWIDFASELILPDSMKISTFGNSYYKYDIQILREEVKGEEFKGNETLEVIKSREWMI